MGLASSTAIAQPDAPYEYPPHQMLAGWTQHAHKNCWWNGNGAEEVDTPRGSSIPAIATLK
eukprot:1225563-Prymnesium_polylepis.1